MAQGRQESRPSDSFGQERLVEATGRSSDDCMYTLQWSDRYTGRYPFVWLFDHCRCAKCFHPESKQKINSMDDVDPEVRPIKEEIVDDGQFLEITWSDDHSGKFPSFWLRQHRFDKDTHFDPISDLKMDPWGAEFGDKIPRFQYDSVMKNDGALFDWLRALYEIGLTLVTDAPTREGVVEELATRVAYVKETHYGKTFQIKTKFDISNVGYTNTRLGLHIDEPYFARPPGVQMMHCINQFRGDGGDNKFADACKAVQLLKRTNSDVYKTLTTVPISFRDCGTDSIKFHIIGAKPTIEEDAEGNFNRIFYSDIVRASYMNAPVEKVQDVYRALKLLHETLLENAVSYKLKAGEVVVFDNTRVLHGRNGFTIDPSDTENVRHYEGVYMDWDPVLSRLRVLREEKHGELHL